MKARFVMGWLCAGATAGAAVGCLGAAFNEGSGGAATSAQSSSASTGAAGAATTSTSNVSAASAASSSSGSVACGVGQTSCSGKCVDLQADPNHCGSCTDGVCDPTEVCVSGKCACRPGFSKCVGASSVPFCVDWQHDSQHCGSCTNACKSSEVCVPAAGTTPAMCSTATCPGGTTDCDGGCYQNFDNTQLSCGQCGDACTNTQACANGKCETAFVVVLCTTCLSQGYKCCSSGGLNFCYDAMGQCPN